MGAGKGATIPKGMRAFTVHVNEVVGVAGFAVAGMHVDVLVSGSMPGGDNEEAGAISRTLLQNVQVMSAGQNYQKDAEGKPVLVQVVNLLVTPAQAEIMDLATDQKIQLVLRNPADNEIVKTPGAATANLFEGGAPHAPRPASPRRNGAPAAPPEPIAPPSFLLNAAAAPPANQVTVEVFAGNKKTESTFRAAPAGSNQ